MQTELIKKNGTSDVLHKIKMWQKIQKLFLDLRKKSAKPIFFNWWKMIILNSWNILFADFKSVIIFHSIIDEFLWNFGKIISHKFLQIFNFF